MVRSGRDSGDGRRRGIPGDPARGRARGRLPLVWEPPRVVGLDGRSGELRPAGCRRRAPGSIDPRAAPLSSSLSGCGSVRTRLDHLARLPFQLSLCPEQRRRRDVRRRSHLDRADQGDDRTRRIPSRGRNPPDHREGGHRLPRRSAGWNRRRAGRVRPGDCRRPGDIRGAASPIGADHAAGMVAEHRFRANACRLHLRALRGRRPLAVWILASEPVGSELRQAVYATRG